MQVLKTLPKSEGLPDAASFRLWLFNALVALKLSASTVSKALGFGKNTLGNFLSAPGREIHLGVASKVTAGLMHHAQSVGVDLAPPPYCVTNPVDMGLVDYD